MGIGFSYFDVMIGDKFVGQIKVKTNPVFPIAQEELIAAAEKQYPSIKKHKYTLALGQRVVWSA